ncbi:type VII secretion protein EccE [Labedaea rhizosphaerae]|uniref:Type VII secretion protein EccE n=1 Tax=Labedaea rhizosphaerae TaxID=598644 RepID=A0A4R6SND2_LABRH|nr:type VII secretion protein EccE [Labedaea rhizosphaerae]
MRPRAAAVLPVDSRRRLVATLRIGQVACWQAAIALVGLAVGRPAVVAAPAGACAAGLLALTTIRVRNQWLFQWAGRYLRFQLRERKRFLPREGHSRALLHLFAKDAALTGIQLGDTDVAVISRTCGATAVLRPQLADADPIVALPRPSALLPSGDEANAVGVQVIFHGISGNRSYPRAWLAVQAIRTPELYEEDQITQSLRHSAQRVLRALGKRDVEVAGLGDAKMLSTIASLAHVSGGRSDVEEQWRCWFCGPVAQVTFRLGGWTDLRDEAAARVLRALLTAQTGAVLTVSVGAGSVDGEVGHETAVVRIAAQSVQQLEAAAAALVRLGNDHDVRFDRMDGEHAEGVAASLPLGVVS